MKSVFASLLLITQSLSAAPNWVPKDKAEAFDRMIQNGERLEGILRSDYVIVGCNFDSDTVKLTIKRHDLMGDIFFGVKAKSCTFQDNRYTIVQDDTPGIPWKEIAISFILGSLIGFGVGSK